jgi:hypothetical protein
MFRTARRLRLRAFPTPSYDEGMTAIEQVREVIEQQLDEIEREIAALRNTLATLESDGDAPGVSPKKRGSGAPRRKARRAKTAEVVPLGKLEQLLGRSREGLSAAAIAKETNGSPAQIRALLKDLEAAGKARRTGERRGTRWSVITEEDWIAQRAAELERRSSLRRERKAA